MNFLAHIHLSGSNEKIIVGNFIGDFIKGKQINELDSEIRKGVELHRAIDQFTDSHEIVLQSKKRLREEFGHYSPVIVDVFYDHFLAKNWESFHPRELSEFCQWFYSLMKKNNELLPDQVKHMLKYMKRDNWLHGYQYIEGIHRALSGMARRTKFESGMEKASNNLKENYSMYEKEFKDFYPLLMEFSQSKLS